MSLKTGIKTADNKDFGRRFYVSKEDYATQMKQTTDRAKLNEKEFHLSEFKKPYATDSYEDMEYQFSQADGMGLMINLPTRVDRRMSEGTVDTTTRTSMSALSWRIEPPDEVEPSSEHYIEVNTGAKETFTYTGGKVTNYLKTYRMPIFSLVKASGDATGFDLEVLVKVNTSHDPYILVRYQYRWYRWNDPLLISLYERGLIIPEATMRAKLITKDNAAGSYTVKVKDGKTTIKKKVTITKAETFFVKGSDGFWYSLVDLSNGIKSPKTVTETKTLLAPIGTSKIQTSVDVYGDPNVFTYTVKGYFDSQLYKTVYWTYTFWDDDREPAHTLGNDLLPGTFSDRLDEVYEDFVQPVAGTTEFVGTITYQNSYIKYSELGVIAVPLTCVGTYSYTANPVYDGLALHKHGYVDSSTYLHVFKNYDNDASYSDPSGWSYEGKNKGISFSYSIDSSFFQPKWDTEVKYGRGVS